MKKFIFGLCLGLFFGMATGAFASVGQKVEAVFAEFIYEVNGERKEIDTPALVYHGTSHLPVRQIANMLGYDVTYLADTKTIRFTTPEVKGMTSQELDEPTKPVSNNALLPTKSIDERIAEINFQLESAKMALDSWLRMKARTTDEGVLSTLESRIAETKATIDELEAKITQLELLKEGGESAIRAKIMELEEEIRIAEKSLQWWQEKYEQGAEIALEGAKDFERQLTELKRQKAELEAQLQQ